MDRGRRSVLAVLGLAMPFSLWSRHASSAPQTVSPYGQPELHLRSFEQALREAFADSDQSRAARTFPCCRVEVGHADLLERGVQGCHNDRPFAGFPAGQLRIVRTGAEPGPSVGGVRLYVSWVEVALTDGRPNGRPGRPLNFATLPPAATLASAETAKVA